MQYLATYQQAKLNCVNKRLTVSKFSANRSFFTKFLAFLCKKYGQEHPFLLKMLLWNIKFNFGTCYKPSAEYSIEIIIEGKSQRSDSKWQ